MQAIETKFLGATNTRGSRVKATAQAGSATVEWSHALSIDENHARAAKALAVRLGWDGDWVGGAKASKNGNVYVCIGRSFEGTFTVKRKEP